MLSVVYAAIKLIMLNAIELLFMLDFTIKPFVLSVVRLNVVMECH